MKAKIKGVLLLVIMVIVSVFCNGYILSMVGETTAIKKETSVTAESTKKVNASNEEKKVLIAEDFSFLEPLYYENCFKKGEG